ncbi:hypothetical protein D9758_013433 [Tetrapyrgos nigripes]|uniref:FAD-binding PCMH-type domain-containing protein n=1 Tax=Tetrapyrgos nigripes TaxID=182062 RepID=A0A8H5CKQ1_9AGAR|nr:hypothetical protein D9758_013433 [Tetrapyrgos nigripes]
MRVASLPSLFISATLAAADLSCKCLYGDACWPSDSEWSEFAQTLTSPEALIVGQRPPGAVCYKSDPSYNEEACAFLQARVDDPVYMSSLTNGAHYNNFNAIINSTTILNCPYKPASDDDVCYQGRVPPYVVNVTKVEEIQSALAFAAKHNLRVTVKNTGHEEMGRAMGVGALEIFMNNFQNYTYFDGDFVPEGAPEGTEGEYAVTLGAGVNWSTAYKSTDDHNRSVVGGLSPMGTVGAAAGWPLGTGQSLLSPFYGLGVDNTLQFTVVLPDGTYLTANRFTTPDLFWAMRGGGGPSFGIVTSTTYRTHPNLPFTGAFFGAQASSTEAYIDLLTVWMKHHNNVSESGWSGNWPFSSRSLYLTMASLGAPNSQAANDSMNNFFDEAATVPGVNITVRGTREYRSWYVFVHENLVDSSNVIGFNFTAVIPGNSQSTTAGWLMPANVTSPEFAPEMAKVMANTTVLAIPFMVGGGYVLTVDPSSSAACPAWRHTITDMVLMGGANDTADIRPHYEEMHENILKYRNLAPPPYGGSYLNEADTLEENFSFTYWGEQYPRLLAIKKEIDPNDLLIVRKGVNSEAWDDEITCKSCL